MKLQAPKDTKRVSFAGVEYEVAADGTLDVPAAALEPLMAHGLVRASAAEPVLERSTAREEARGSRPTAATRKGA